jgi:hypothetical protein
MRGNFDVRRIGTAVIAVALGRAAETVANEDLDDPSKTRPSSAVQSALVVDNTAHRASPRWNRHVATGS